MSTSREGFLERKISILERRITLVERFVESRFSASLKEFSSATTTSSCDRGIDNFKDEGRNNGDQRKSDSSVQSKLERDSCETTESVAENNDRKQLETRPKPKKDRGSSAGTTRSPEEPVKTRVGTRSSVLANRPAPASVKRKAAVKAATSTSAVTPEEKESVTVPVSRESRSTRTVRRMKEAIVIVEDYTKRPRYNTRRKRAPNTDESRDCADDKHKKICKSSLASSVVAHKTDNQDEECVSSPPAAYEDDGYFTFPGNPGEKEKSPEPDWCPDDAHVESDSFDEGDDDIYITPDVRRRSTKTKRENKSGNAASKRRGRKPKPPSDTRPKRVYIRSSFMAVPTDSIVGSDPTKKECPVCHMHFKLDVIDAHMEGHMKERHLKCPECDKAYYNQSMLRKHMRVHQPDKYGKKCRQCEKLFVQTDKVLAHERICIKKALERNEQVDPEIIEDIKKRSSSGWMNEAPGNSSNVDPSTRKQCPRCKKNFKASFYEKHLRSHDNPRNWSCNLCEKAYVHKHDLVRHVATEHVENPSCELCHQSFKDRTTLKQHTKTCRRANRDRFKITEVISLKSSSESTNMKVEAMTDDESDSDDTDDTPKCGKSTDDAKLTKSNRSHESLENAKTIQAETKNTEPTNEGNGKTAGQASLVLASSTNDNISDAQDTITELVTEDEIPSEVAAEEIVS